MTPFIVGLFAWQIFPFLPGTENVLDVLGLTSINLNRLESLIKYIAICLIYYLLTILRTYYFKIFQVVLMIPVP